MHDEYVSYEKRECSNDDDELWLIVSEQDTQEIQRALETEVNAEQLQLQQQLQQANETIAKLLEQRKPTSQSLSELFCMSCDNELSDWLPRDAMHKRRLCRHAVRGCVCPSRSWIMSKRINVSSKFFHRRVDTSF